MQLILKILNGREITAIVDETGDPKKGKTTDDVKRQYIGNLGQLENGIVAVTVYGLIDNLTIPLTFEVYQPQERLKPGDKYKSKPQLAGEMLQELRGMGFNFKLVLADS